MNACPSGWHLPTDDEWKQLELELEMREMDVATVSRRGDYQGEMLKARNGWRYSNGTDEVGFGALPGGLLTKKGKFEGVNDHAIWWTATESNELTVWDRQVDSRYVDRFLEDKSAGLSVRCVKD